MSPAPPLPSLGYSVPEVAEILRVPVSTIRYWRLNNKGPRFVNVGRRLVC